MVWNEHKNKVWNPHSEEDEREKPTRLSMEGRRRAAFLSPRRRRWLLLLLLLLPPGLESAG